MKKNKSKLIFLMVLSILLVIPWLSGFILAYDKTYTAYVSYTTHIDTAWNWTYASTINNAIYNTFTNAINCINTYPQFKFQAPSAQHHEWVKEYYPTLWNNIKTAYNNGKWFPLGGHWVEADSHMPSGESTVRSWLYAQEFYKHEFGAKRTEASYTDVFTGLSSTLPQIAIQGGAIGLSTGHVNCSSSPDYSILQGIDGSNILFRQPIYVTGMSEGLTQSLATPGSIGLKRGFTAYGQGDFGGGPNTSEIQSLINMDNDPAQPHVTFASPSTFYQDAQPYLSSFQPLGDNEQITEYSGSFTSQGAFKKYMRKFEVTAETTEKASSIADWLGAATYPLQRLQQMWKKHLTMQFHDIISGTSVSAVYDQTWNDYELASNMLGKDLNFALAGIANRADTNGSGIPVLVFNPMSFTRTNTVETNVTFTTTPVAVKVFDSTNTEIPSQVLSINGNTARILFTAQSVPSLGYKVYWAQTAASPGSYNTGLSAGSNAMDSNRYRVEIDPGMGNISRIYDKLNSKEVVASGQQLGLQVLYDWPANYPTWSMQYDQMSATPISGWALSSITLEENGPIRTVYKVVNTFNNSSFGSGGYCNSTITRRYTLYANEDRVDVRTTVDWNASKAALKAQFPLNASNSAGAWDTGYGAIQRGNATTAKYEVPGQKWADITNSDGTFGTSILNDCKYGWDKFSNNQLRLTLLKSCHDQDNDSDIGAHDFTYSIYNHNGNWTTGGTVQEADELNYPLIGFQATTHTGTLGKYFSFASVNANNVMITAMKKAEDSTKLVLRLVELQGAASTNVTVTLAGNINSIQEANFLEEPTGAPTYSGNNFSTTMSKYQIKTFLIDLASPYYSNTKPASTNVNLSSYYNLDGISYDTARNNGNFDGQGNTYSADLMPASIVFNDISFNLGPKSAGANNFVQLNGQTITLPSGQYQYLYLLGASSGNSGGTFTVNYTDATSTSQNLILTDWCANIGGWKQAIIGDAVGYYFSHRHLSNGDDYARNNYLFVYRIPLNSAKTVSNLVVPVATGAKIAAITLVNGSYLPEINPTSNSALNLALGKTVTANSFYTTGEEANKAVDGLTTTKWCATAKDNGAYWLKVDLGQNCSLTRWVVKHAGINESTSYNTRDFKLQKSNDGNNWTDVDTVTGNAANVTDRSVNAFIARYVRLYVTYADQTTNSAVRIPEFEVYGTASPSPSLFFTSLEAGDTQPSWSDTAEYISNVTGYTQGLNPQCSTRTNEQAHTGTTALMYSGTAGGGSTTYVYYKVFSVNIPITSTTILDYWIYPQQDNGRYVAVDFHCTDGATLRDSGAVDQNGYNVHPNAGHGGNIPLNAWSEIKSNVGAKLAGKTVDKIWVAYDRPGSTGQFRGYIDDIVISN